jgi:hypothetical protein
MAEAKACARNSLQRKQETCAPAIGSKKNAAAQQKLSLGISKDRRQTVCVPKEEECFHGSGVASSDRWFRLCIPWRNRHGDLLKKEDLTGRRLGRKQRFRPFCLQASDPVIPGVVTPQASRREGNPFVTRSAPFFAEWIPFPSHPSPAQDARPGMTMWYSR